MWYSHNVIAANVVDIEPPLLVLVNIAQHNTFNNNNNIETIPAVLN